MAVFNRKPELNEERITTLRADIDAYIDAKVAEEKEHAPHVPSGVLRNILTARTGGCQCESFLAIKARDEA